MSRGNPGTCCAATQPARIWTGMHTFQRPATNLPPAIAGRYSSCLVHGACAQPTAGRLAVLDCQVPVDLQAGLAKHHAVPVHLPRGLHHVAIPHNHNVEAIPDEAREVGGGAVLRLHSPVQHIHLEGGGGGEVLQAWSFGGARLPDAHCWRVCRVEVWLYALVQHVRQAGGLQGASMGTRLVQHAHSAALTCPLECCICKR